MLNLLRVFSAILVLAAIATQLTIHIIAGFSIINFFSYFTNLSNLIAALVFIGATQAITNNYNFDNDFWRAQSAINMSVVGIVFVTLLRSADLGALLPWVNFVLHYLMPIVVLFEWLLNPPKQRFGLRDALLCQIFPVLYLAYTMIRGALIGWYPYPFLTQNTLAVIQALRHILLAFAAFSWLLQLY